MAACLCAALLSGTGALASNHSIPFPKAGAAFKVISNGKNKLFITKNEVLLYRGERLINIYRDAAGIHDAALQRTILYVATRKGLKRINVANDFRSLPELFAGQDISCLTQDNQQRLWVGSTHQGAFLQRSADSFELKIQIPSVLSIAASGSDTNVWVGTNVGLYRIGTQSFSTTRYAEEGYAGYELPDNIVEHLFADELSNVWVVMPDNISFKKGNSFQGDMPTFDFLGDRGNEIRSVIAVKDAWYLFVTANGISYMPIRVLQEEHPHATEEVHESHNMQARTANNHQLHCPAGWEGAAVSGAQKDGSDVWFFTDKGCWRVPERKLHSMLRG